MKKQFLFANLFYTVGQENESSGGSEAQEPIEDVEGDEEEGEDEDEEGNDDEESEDDEVGG